MTDDGAADAVQAKWLADWQAAVTAHMAGTDHAAVVVDTTFELEKYNAPTPPVPYAYVVMDSGQAERMTMGRPAKFRTTGTIYVKLHWPLAAANGYADGVGWLRKLAMAVRDTLSVQQFAEGPNEDGVICRVAQLTESATEGAYAILAVLVPFEYTETR